MSIRQIVTGLCMAACLALALVGIGFGLAGLLGRRPEKNAWACTAVAAVSVLCHILMLLFNR